MEHFYGLSLLLSNHPQVSRKQLSLEGMHHRMDSGHFASIQVAICVYVRACVYVICMLVCVLVYMYVYVFVLASVCVHKTDDIIDDIQ